MALLRIVVLLLCFAQICRAQQADFEEIKIGILGDYEPASAQVIIEFGHYAVWADGRKIGALAPRERITFIRRGEKTEVSLPEKMLGTFTTVELVSAGREGVFRLYLLKPRREERVYDDHLIISSAAGSLRLINRVNLEKYIAGVVEAESGKEKGAQYYMAQAIISRTYALSNRRRYLKHGYNLNDRTDCQVYHGKARWEPAIPEAVRATESLVLTDSEMNLITAAFHSNSGGHTVASSAVWSGALPYLSPRRDDFSLEGDHFEWNAALPREEWLSYLSRRHGVDTEADSLSRAVLHFVQPLRTEWFSDPALGIPLREIRKDFGLNSTWFDLTSDADSVYFTGRGFGHGTGLSQEGAMRMAALGFSCTDILHFYYNDVHIIDLRSIGFFRED